MAKQATWTHKVVKMARGGDSKWFAHRTAGTFPSEAEAVAYAESFAAEQRESGVSGTRIVVIVRKGGKTIYGCNVNRGDVTASLANANVPYV